MKKKLVLVGVIGTLFLSSLNGCGSTREEKAAVECATKIGFEKCLSSNDNLYYDKDTKIVYYLLSTNQHFGQQGYGYGYMSPYYSENGNICKYNLNTNKIEEIK